MPTKHLAVIVAALAAVTALASAAVNTSSSDAATAGPVVSTAKSKLGRILVNAQGRTLYLFERDRKGKSSCTGQCAKFWPAVRSSRHISHKEAQKHKCLPLIFCALLRLFVAPLPDKKRAGKIDLPSPC